MTAALFSVAERRRILGGITRPWRGIAPPVHNPLPHSGFEMRNRVRMQVVGPNADGKITTKQTTPWCYNIMNTFGLDSLAAMIGSGAVRTASSWISACRIGTGTTAATSTDAALVNSTASVVITAASMTNTYLTARTLEYRATFASNNPAGAASIQEVALYCDSTATTGNLAARSVLTGASSVNKGASDVINLSYDIIFTTA
jgi:hypothetical protein